MFAEIVRELTGDWVHPIKCDDIQGENRWYFDEVVYLGAKKDFAEDGPLSFLNTASMVDRYSYDEQRVGFFYNEDKECRRLRDLDVDKNYIVFYNGENSIPFLLEPTNDEVTLPRLIYELAVGVVKGTPRWG